MKFTKLHGYGNDYIVFEAAEMSGVASLNEFARRVCDRHYGAGADGIAVVEKSDGAASDFALRIINPDGSEAAMSGNGSRCAAAYLHHGGLWSEEVLRLSTRAGVKRFTLRERTGRGRFRFEAEIGTPLFESAQIPMLTDEPLPLVRDYALSLDDAGDGQQSRHPRGETVRVTALQMCNPNCCVFVEDFDAIDWRRVGRLIESHRQFPERTNVEFIRVHDRAHVEARVWERGVGETLSSGTGASSVAVACIVNELTERRVSVEMPGGRLEVEWRAADGEVLLTGEAEVIYEGEWKADLRT